MTPEQRANKTAREYDRRRGDPLRKQKRMAQPSSQPGYVSDQVKVWRQGNHDRFCEIQQTNQTERLARIARATPRWLTGDQKAAIDQWYSFARMLHYEVDHIVPLKGVDGDGNHVISGLHVPWNLQTLSPTENRKKGNKLC